MLPILGPEAPAPSRSAWPASRAAYSSSRAVPPSPAPAALAALSLPAGLRRAPPAGPPASPGPPAPGRCGALRPALQPPPPPLPPPSSRARPHRPSRRGCTSRACACARALATWEGDRDVHAPQPRPGRNHSPPGLRASVGRIGTRDGGLGAGFPRTWTPRHLGRRWSLRKGTLQIQGRLSLCPPFPIPEGWCGPERGCATRFPGLGGGGPWGRAVLGRVDEGGGGGNVVRS